MNSLFKTFLITYVVLAIIGFGPMYPFEVSLIVTCIALYYFREHLLDIIKAIGIIAITIGFIALVVAFPVFFIAFALLCIAFK